MERDQILLCFARFFLDHVRKAKKVTTRKVKMHANTIPAMAPEVNDDVEKVLLFCDKGASEGDKVDEDWDTREAGNVDEVGVGVGGVDVLEEELIVLVIKVVVVFNGRLLDWEVVECEGVGIKTSDRNSMIVTVLGIESPVLFPLLLSSICQTAMSFTISEMS